MNQMIMNAVVLLLIYNMNEKHALSTLIRLKFVKFT